MDTDISQVPTASGLGPRARGRQDWKWLLGTALTLIALTAPVYFALRGRAKAQGQAAPATPTVGVTKIGRADLFLELPEYAEFRPYLEVTLHAKVAGYLDQMNVDFGDKVKKGQLLATLEAPDLVAQLDNAVATERKAAAAYTNAHLIYSRKLKASKEHPEIPNLIAPQELDTAEANDLTTFAAIGAARADREKYQTLVGYLKITAPFDGVITKRFADPGALIQAGTASDTQSMPLVRLSDNYRLRLDFPVEVKYVKDIRDGDQVTVRVESLSDKTFKGTITRFANKIEEDTRTMNTEVEVDNPNLELIPGMYARVLLQVQRRRNVVAVPTDAVNTDRNKSTVYVVTPDNTLEERTVTLGLETPTRFEVLGGLKEGDLVAVGPRSQITPGTKIVPKLSPSLTQR